MVVFDDVCFSVCNCVCVVNVCMLPQPGKNGYADRYEFKSNQTELGQPYSLPPGPALQIVGP